MAIGDSSGSASLRANRPPPARKIDFADVGRLTFLPPLLLAAQSASPILSDSSNLPSKQINFSIDPRLAKS